ncbi:molybdenum cofactor guanylyltransferase [Microbacterium excoecariae]|uniref:molybdenum cofactor guanylyltransferase n=1 Tax=Microbacterium excoecariae TaxID=2715210 RepID=UPI00140DDA8D|nr:NTP transferase domain-containing protein [Microbacterium excoecariae]NHI15815.1 NTP transferase domain-containing protein [Microbacterium excoecariae]
MGIAAIILAGGRSARLGGVHKPALEVGGASILDRVAGAARRAAPGAAIVIAGSAEGLRDLASTTVVREDPPFGGPFAGVAAALPAVGPDAHAVLLLGGDMPRLTPGLLTTLLAAAGERPAVARDAASRLQPLCSAWPATVLRARIRAAGPPANLPLRALLEGVDPVAVDAPAGALDDVDTPGDLARARRDA